MTRLRIWFARLGELFRRQRLDAELSEELQTHVDLLAADFERRGFAPEAARRAAKLELGGVEQTREAVRDRRGFRLLDALMSDARLAVRRLRQAPGFTTAVVATLALGIGAATAIFSLVDGVLLQPLGYPDPDRVVSLVETVSPPPGAEPGRNRVAVAPANLADYRVRAAGLVRLAEWSREVFTLTGHGQPDRAAGEAVGSDYFDVLGTRPVVGRAFRADEFVEGASPVVVVSHALWQDRFGGDLAAVGQPLTIDGVDHRIVGVTPPGFQAISDLTTGDPVAVLVPLVVPADMLTGRGEHILQVVGRLAPAVAQSVAQSALTAAADAIAASDPRAGDLGVELISLLEDRVGSARPLLTVLMAGVGVVLLSTWASVAGLLVVRSVRRRREVAVRVALGASRARVLLDLSVQHLMLGLAGGFAGLLLAFWLLQLLVGAAPPGLPRIDQVSLDWRAIGFLSVVSVVTTMVFGLLPTLQVSRARPHLALQSTVRPIGGGWTPRSWAALLCVEVAVSTLLLVGAGLMVRSLHNLNDVDLGFNPTNVVAANVPLPASRYQTPDARLAFFQAVAERLAAHPDVAVVAFGNRLPLRGNWSSGLVLEGADPSPDTFRAAGFQAVSPEYFDTFRIPLLAGRSLTPADREGAPPAAVVSEAFVADLLGGEAPIGRRFQRFPGAPLVEIVGVVGDLRRGGRLADVEPQVYLAAAQTSVYPLRLAELAVRTDAGADVIAAAIRAAVWEVDADQPVTAVRTLDETLALAQAGRRFQTVLFGLFAAFAVVLVVVGIYSVVAYAVSQRLVEIGLRIALGASIPRVVGWIVVRSSVPIAPGILLGLVAAWATTRYVASLLFGVGPTDPATYAGAAGLLAVVALAACLSASHRATQVDAAELFRS